MTEHTPHVGPVFARVSVIVFALLTPVVAHAIWDYVEMRRLRTRIEAIAAKGEPTTAALGLLEGPAAEAARYYTAAGALLFGFTRDVPPALWSEIMAAERSDAWPPELVDGLRALMTRHAEALALLDRAAALPFDGFQAGTTSNYTTANLVSAARLCQLRAHVRALDGQPDPAVESLYTGLRLTRVTKLPSSLQALSSVLRRARPSPAAAVKLGTALAEIDRDDQLKTQFAQMRAIAIDRSGASHFPVSLEPWDIHMLNGQLDNFAALIAAAERPEADRHAAVMAVGEWPGLNLPSPLSRKQLEVQVSAVERQTAAIRCARRLIAGEVVNCSP